MEGEFSELLRGNLRECFCEIVVSLSSSKRGKLMGPPGVLMGDKLTKDLICVLEFCLSCNRLKVLQS